MGSSQGYFGTEGAAENAFAFHTQSDVDRLMPHLDECLQKASQTQDPIERQRLLTFAIVGCGGYWCRDRFDFGGLLAAEICRARW